MPGWESPSSAFTQTRLFWPDGVKILFLMLTYLSTLRSKTGFFLVRPEKCVFCKFTQHQPSPSLRSGEFKEGNATTSSSWRLIGERQKGRGAERQQKAKEAGKEKKQEERGDGVGEPVERIYANPTFLA